MAIISYSSFTPVMSELQKIDVSVDRKLKSQQVMVLMFSVIAGILGVLSVGGGLEFIKQHFFREPVEVIFAISVEKEPAIEPQKQTVEVHQEEIVEDLLTSNNTEVLINLPDPVEHPVVEIVPENIEFSSEDVLGDVSLTDAESSPFRLPITSSKRCTRQDRLRRIEELGGVAESEDAVEAALQYLVDTQNEDGSWSKGNDISRVSLTSLSVIAFLGRCETPVSVNLGYRNCVQKALDFLVNKAVEYEGDIVNNGPHVHESAYVQAVMAYALCESYTFCSQINYTGVEGLESAVKYSVNAIIEGQNENGGWVYEYGENGNNPDESDSSIVGWSMQALKAAQLTGLRWENMNEAIMKGKEVLLQHQQEDGTISYRLHRNSSRKSLGLTMAGVLVFQQHKGDKKAIRKGLDYFVKNVPKLDYKAGGSVANIYDHYYASQVMVNTGGRYWEHYRDLYLQPTLANQNPDGSFQIPNSPVLMGSFDKGIKGRVYTTTMSILMLEVFYRFLPTNQNISLSKL